MNKNIALLMLVGVLTACVTINIYFPAAAADKAADKIIDDVWQLKNGQNKDNSAPDNAPTTSTNTAPESK